MAIPLISDLLEKLFGPGEDPHSRDDVKRRLKIVLAHDRLALDPQTLEMMRQEIIAVVSRYVEVDFENLEFSLATDQRVTALTANLPIRRIRPLGKEPDQPIDPTAEAERIELASKAEIMAMDAKETAAALRQFESSGLESTSATLAAEGMGEGANALLDIDRSGLDESEEDTEELTLDPEGELEADELVGEPAPSLPDMSVPDTAKTGIRKDESETA